MITPAEVGVPSKFTEYRDQQLEALIWAVNSDKRFVALGAPCGIGKSLIAISKALMLGARTVILTRTKPLQSQYESDFCSIGMTDIRGQSSYQCIAAPDFGIEEEISVDAGPCHIGVNCPIRNTDCLYYSAVGKAKLSNLVITNYDLWMNITAHGDGLGNFDLMVCDEGHDAEKAVSGFLTAEIHEWSLEHLIGVRFPKCSIIDEWRSWGASARDQAKYRLDGLSRRMKDLRVDAQKIDRKLAKEVKSLRELVKQLDILAGSEGEWVAEVRDKTLTFAPVWPAQYAEQVLFRKVPKVLIMSATIVPKTLSLLGVGRALYDFLEVESSFPVENRPVVHIPTVKLNAGSSEAEKKLWVSKIDQIISSYCVGGELDRKGIIHSVAYKHRDFIMKHSKYRHLMMSHARDNVRSVVESFKRSETAKILVSPSVTTGLDFPDTDCEFQIVAKMPFPDVSSLVVQAKADADPQYVNYIVAQQLVQMAGRANRSHLDLCTTYIVDDSWVWFRNRNEGLFPKWFLDACYTSEAIPKPLPKL